MPRTFASVPCALLLLTLAACSGDDLNGEPSGDAGAAAGDCGWPLEATLHDAGDDPQRILELSPAAGDRIELEMWTAVETELLIDGEDSSFVDTPDIHLGMVVTVDEVNDDEIVMSFEYDDARATTATHVAMTEAVESVAGLTGTLTTSRSGGFADVEIADRAQLESGAGHEVPVVLGDLEWMLTDMPVLFPDEAVGIGGRWTTAYPTDGDVLPACIQTTYTLTALDDESYEVSVEWAEDVVPTTVERDGAMSAEVVGGSTAGSITSSGTLGSPLPETSSIVVSHELEEEVERDGAVETRERTTVHERGFERRR
ncbi:DUF6263 family protein [Phytoactinopolyspora mesophila]|uniref:Uncharacterized protein n=1 Tax=Phytoactinopolyspora mesophila TaxID=2650750 RepID=A0A7K3LWZ3_9ACTN|nr:DUF6263 family protein [Phytoactinopolyspora mesophila]NDL55480.1 hypothetical protein [Phytoactinopolyspora mesophila]